MARLSSIYNLHMRTGRPVSLHIAGCRPIMDFYRRPYDLSSPPLTIACSFCLRAISSCDWSVYQGAIKFSRSAADDRGRTKCREIDIAGLCSGLLIKYA